jgi:hypothetical protein
MYETSPTYDLDLQPSDPVKLDYCDTCDQEASWDETKEAYTITHGCSECTEEISKKTCEEWAGMCPQCAYIYHL